VREATGELIALGHRQFLYLAGPVGNYHDNERYLGVLEALAEAGLSEKAVVRSGGTLDYQHGFQIGVAAAAEFADLTQKPTAVIATSDDMAISFMSCVQRMGWKIPEDLSIVSFDGAPVCEYSSPPLSTIEQPVEEMGQLAVSLLMERIDAPERGAAARHVISSKLIRRESFGPVWQGS
jgi:DNA-binding LacI/PurR family transcriptional regulator